MDRSICNSYKTMYWQTNPVWDMQYAMNEEEVDDVQKVSLAEPDEADEAEYVDDEEAEVQKVSLAEPDEADEAEYVDDEEAEVQKVSLVEPVKPVSRCKCGQR